MNLRDFGNSPAATNSYTVTLTLNVEDAQALWTAAADKALDPAIMDCIAMLTAPGAIAGCALDNFDVSAAASAELIPLTGRPVLMSVAG